MKYKRAIFYGCSLTAGAELADPWITGLSPEKLFELKKQKNDQVRTNTLKEFFANYIEPIVGTPEEHLRLERELSWAPKLADKLNIPYINYALSGNGAIDFLYNVVATLDSLSEDDIVFIGITTPHRLSKIEKTFNWPFITGSITNITEVLHVNSSKELIAFYKYFNEEQFAIETFKALHHIKLLLDRKGIKYYFVNTTWEKTYPEFLEYISPTRHTNKEFDKSIELYWGEINQNILDVEPLLQIATNDGFDPFVNNGKCLGFFHPIEKYHVTFADNIYRKLIDDQLV